MANGNVVPTKMKNGKVVEYTVYPTGDTTIYPPCDPDAYNSQGPAALPPNAETPDKKNVQFAIDNIADDGTVILKRHRLNDNPSTVTPFNFGGDCPLVNTIFLTKSVKITGDENPQPEWTDAVEGWSCGVKQDGGTTITGGRVPFTVGLDPATNQYVPVRVSITNIRFTSFYRCAIRTFASTGKNLISNCSFVSYPKNGDFKIQQPPGAFPIVVDSAGRLISDPSTGQPKRDPIGEPEKLGGELQITYNFFGEAPTEPTLNFLHVSDCNLKFTFSNNRVTDMYLAGVAVYANKGETNILKNSIRKQSNFVLEGAAISVGARPQIYETNAPEAPHGKISIEDNTVEVESTNSSGISLFLLHGAYYEPPAHDPKKIVIKNNKIHILGNGEQERAAMACLGACSHSDWVHNTVKGEACYGIWVSDHRGIVSKIDVQTPSKTVTLDPSGNTFKDNDFSEFKAMTAEIFIGPTAAGATMLSNNKFGGP